MTKIRNVRKATKFKRSIRAISPVIATLLMIAIAVVASLVVYAWVTGYIGGTTSKTGNSIQIQSAAPNSDGKWVVYVQNVGQGVVSLKPSQSVYFNGNLVSFAGTNDITIAEGQTVELVTTASYTEGEKAEIKVTTSGGTFTQITKTGTSTTTTGGEEDEGINANSFTITAPAGSTDLIVAADSSFTVTAQISLTAGSTDVSTQLSVPAGYTITTTNPVVHTVGTSNVVFEWTVTAPSSAQDSANIQLTATASGFNPAAGSFPVTTEDAPSDEEITLLPMAHGYSENLDRYPSETGSHPHEVEVHNWQDVDELSSDGDTSYVYRNDHLHFDTYAMENSGMTTGTIQQITVHIMAKVTGGSGTATEYIRTGGTDYYNPSAHTLTTTYVDYTYTWTTNPKTQTTWTLSDIDALECGVGLSQSGGENSDSARCTQVWVEVTYTP